MKGGGWRVEGGGWRLEVGDWRLEGGGWRLEEQGTLSFHASPRPLFEKSGDRRVLGCEVEAEGIDN